MYIANFLHKKMLIFTCSVLISFIVFTIMLPSAFALDFRDKRITQLTVPYSKHVNTLICLKKNLTEGMNQLKQSEHKLLYLRNIELLEGLIKTMVLMHGSLYAASVETSSHDEISSVLLNITTLKFNLDWYHSKIVENTNLILSKETFPLNVQKNFAVSAKHMRTELQKITSLGAATVESYANFLSEYPSINSIRAQFIEILDDDSILVETARVRTRVRLLNVDCPGYYQTGGTETHAFIQKFLGKEGAVYLEFEKERFDPYNRLIAYIWKDGTMLNKKLVQVGLCRAKIASLDEDHVVK
ncbi:thermonuclease family protein [Halodesulfovibrio spirochaetisodalis]|uniref:TNase-like domain-containing protein n=1 Tax=Halodesulfovibrio spirochaetisodalis TaxID=1560234 RepID=A0A1B7XAJ5_9BACT|nr:thermonuclease family protein [Halodesulfovibrio spirochaetisodalis]OBQ46403.1 hypothetical protein SP90_12810 [Halodesulfovibrio spirochaetisodalis]